MLRDLWLLCELNITLKVTMDILPRSWVYNLLFTSIVLLTLPYQSFSMNGFPMIDPAKFHIEIFKREFLRKINLTHRPYMKYSPSKTKENIFGKIFTNDAVDAPSTTESPEGNYYAEIKDVVSLSESPNNIANDNIIQFRVVRDAQGRKLEVTSANLLVKVKYPRKIKGHRRKLNKRRKVSLFLSTVTDAGKRNQTIATIKKAKIRKTTWFKLKIPEAFIQSILDSDEQVIRLHIKCKGCKNGVKLVLVRGSRRRKKPFKKFKKKPRRKQRALSRTRPFLILHTKMKTYLRPKRRARNCGYNETSACCKMNIVFNFAEFGWDDWILSPAQFTTGVCKGECTRRRNNGPYSDENSQNNRSVARTCKATRQKPLRIIYQMDDNTIIRSALPNMITTRCGCRA